MLMTLFKVQLHFSPLLQSADLEIRLFTIDAIDNMRV